MPDKKLLFVTHRILSMPGPATGGADVLVGHLEKTFCVDRIEHDLHSKTDSKANIDGALSTHWIWRPSREIGWIFEVVQSAFILRKGSRYDFALASNPLCAFICLLLKRMRKIDCYAIHLVDYADKRFSNFLTSAIYQFLVKVSINHAVIISVVSKRTLRVLEEKCPNALFYHLPNSPDFFPEFTTYERQDILVITAKIIDKMYDYERLLSLFSQLLKEFSGLELIIAGSFIENEYKSHLLNVIDDLDISASVKFVGYLSDRELMDLCLKAKVGLTMYKDSETGFFAKYGDSLKIRFYAACGLPTVTEPIYETAFEAVENGCGFICENDDEYLKTIASVLRGSHRGIEKKCIDWARINNKKSFLEKYEQTVISSMGGSY